MVSFEEFIHRLSSRRPPESHLDMTCFSYLFSRKEDFARKHGFDIDDGGFHHPFY